MSVRIFIEGYFENLYGHLKKFSQTGSPGSLHNLRVDLKKIRAAGKLLEAGTNKPQWKKIHRRIKDFFSAAGEIREQQLAENFFIKNDLHPVWVDWRNGKKAGKKLKKLQARAGKFLQWLEKAQPSVLEMATEWDEAKVTEYSEHLIGNLEARLTFNPPKNQWHDIRKIVKQCLYTAEWMENTRIFTEQQNAYLNQLQKLIGDWHDAIYFEELLTRLLKKYKNWPPFAGPLFVAQKNLKEHKALLEKEIQGQFGEYKSKVSS